MFTSMKKCLTCPYKLGIIKCKISPCPQCIESNRKTNPFSEKKATVYDKKIGKDIFRK